MTSRIRASVARAGATISTATTATAATMVTSTAALAHTGHGHDGLSTFQGLLHALREPDHLVMIALGVIVIGATSPFVLRAATWLGRRVAVAVRRAIEARAGRQGAEG
jgi:hydrogenase/urease accessory protein HupE